MSQSWDQEFAILAREVEQLDQYATHILGKKIVDTRKESLARLHGRFTAARNFVRDIAHRRLALAKRESALVHWGEVVGAKLEAFSSESSRYLNTMLWLRLIQSRISSMQRGSTFDVDELELVDLAMQTQKLEKTLRKLKSVERRMVSRREKMSEQMSEGLVHRENAAAAGSLSGKLGTTSSDALASPTVKALGTFVRQITEPVWLSTNPPSSILEKLAAEKKEAWRLAKDLALSKNPEGTSKEATKEKRAELNKRLQNIRRLEHDARIPIVGFAKAIVRPSEDVVSPVSKNKSQ